MVIEFDWDGTFWRPRTELYAERVIELYPEHQGYGALTDEDLGEFIRRAVAAAWVVRF